MKKNILSIVGLSIVTLGMNFSNAKASEIVRTEAYLTKSNFDGSKFAYEYTAFDASSEVAEEKSISCGYGLWNNQMVLKSLDIRIFISASYDAEKGFNRIKKGTVDVVAEMSKCLAHLPASSRAINAPVKLNLPSISVPTSLVPLKY